MEAREVQVTTLKSSVAELEANLHMAKEQKAKAKQDSGNTQARLKTCSARWNESGKQVRKFEPHIDKVVAKDKHFQSHNNKLKIARA